ncbi:aldo/keto reductase [Pseudolysinimonas sp.]|uniref:aldo/keto reductase n=1 Tax=Pseudolysinimonas sp. TaxID=2680009 RepID=UPI003F80F2AE
MSLSPVFPLAGRDVPRIGYGAMQLREADPAAAVDLLREAIDLGVRHLDTAEFYTGVNELIRAALHPYADDLVLATKVGAIETPDGDLRAAQKPAEIRAQVEANLRSLGVDRLGLVYLRRADRAPGILATGDQVVPIDDQLAELAALRDEGAITGIGLSTVSVDQLREALPVGIAAVQNAYNLAAREDEPSLELAAEHGVAWVPFFPLGSAFEVGPNVPDAHRRLMSVTALPEVTTAAAQLGATPSQVALAWLLQHRENVLLIPGTRTSTHLRENLAAGGLELPADVVAALDAVAG